MRLIACCISPKMTTFPYYQRITSVLPEPPEMTAKEKRDRDSQFSVRESEAKDLLDLAFEEWQLSVCSAFT
jgi:hypothetical protein